MTFGRRIERGTATVAVQRWRQACAAAGQLQLVLDDPDSGSGRTWIQPGVELTGDTPQLSLPSRDSAELSDAAAAWRAERR